MTIASGSRTGRRHSTNEDRRLSHRDLGLFAVIDGMGGQAAGEVAAELAQETLLECVRKGKSLEDALLQANNEVFRKTEEKVELRGMGCVATAAQVSDQQLRIAHVGDTRAYLVGESHCDQLTRDHTEVADIQQADQLKEEDYEQLDGRNRVTRDVGREHRDAATGWIASSATSFEYGDVLLLCTDGVSDSIRQQDLIKELRTIRADQPSSLAASAERLLELAARSGGGDDMTLVLVRFDGPPPKKKRRRRHHRRFGSRLVGAAKMVLAAIGVVAVFLIGLVLGARGGEWPSWWQLSPPATLSATLDRTLDGSERIVFDQVFEPGSRSVVTRVGDSARPELVGHLLATGDEAIEWSIYVGTGSHLRLSDAVAEGSALRVLVFLERGAELMISDSRFDVRDFLVFGESDSRFLAVESEFAINGAPGDPEIRAPVEQVR